MKNFQWFVGIDWATEAHQVCGELHPEALTDPDVNVFIHPARATE